MGWNFPSRRIRHRSDVWRDRRRYAAAMAVAALRGDRVFTQGQMLDHPERRRALTAWDRGDAPQQTRQPAAAVSPRRDSSDTLSTIEAPHG